MNQEISLIAAFIAGFLSFFAPCILPLLPPYFAWLLGISQEEIEKRSNRLKIVISSIFLVLGFSVVFIILGASASKLGQVLASYRLLIQKIGGLLIIFFGLNFVGLLTIFKNKQKLLVKKAFSKLNYNTGSFLIGATFAFGWVACFSPILGSILVLSSFQTTLNQGAMLLGFYTLGLAIPFILSSLFLGFVLKKINFLTKISKWINLFSGSILILLGLLFFTDNYYKIVMWLTNLLNINGGI